MFASTAWIRVSHKTVTENKHELHRPARLVATFVITVVPAGKKLPQGGVETTGTFGSYVLCAVTAKVTIAPLLLLQLTTKFDGQLILTGEVSITGSVKSVVPMLPKSSTTEMVMGWIPGGSRVPVVGVCVGVGSCGSQLS